MHEASPDTNQHGEMPLQTEVNYAAVIARVAESGLGGGRSHAIIKECEHVLLLQAEIVEHLYREYTTPPL